jgi:hypothetical protein
MPLARRDLTHQVLQILKILLNLMNELADLNPQKTP